jgi:hypothetical protein
VRGVSRAVSAIHRSPAERIAAWLLTGPLGHLLAFLSDAGALWLRWAGGGVRRRLVPARRGRPETAP